MRTLIVIFTLAVLTVMTGQTGAQETGQQLFDFDGSTRCINLAGLEFGEDMLGTFNTTYTTPIDSLKYFADMGFNIVRLPISSERLLSDGYIDLIRSFLDEAKDNGVFVIIDMRSNKVRDGGGITAEELIASWTTLLSENDAAGFPLAYHPALLAVGLLNEPNSFDEEWPAVAQETTDAIDEILPREVSFIVGGAEWSTASAWERVNSNLNITRESGGEIRYEFHQYADANGWGDEYDETLPSDDLLTERIEPVLNWLDRTGNLGLWGEVGVRQDNPAWFDTLDTALEAAESSNVPVCLWAAGPWWGDYPLNLEPINAQSAPLIQHLSETGWLKPE